MPLLENAIASASGSGSSYPSRVGSVADCPLKEDAIAWMSPTPADTPIEEMRRRFRENGYLYVKGILPREDVLDVREQYVPFRILLLPFSQRGQLALGKATRCISLILCLVSQLFLISLCGRDA